MAAIILALFVNRLCPFCNIRIQHFANFASWIQRSQFFKVTKLEARSTQLKSGLHRWLKERDRMVHTKRQTSLPNQSFCYELILYSLIYESHKYAKLNKARINIIVPPLILLSRSNACCIAQFGPPKLMAIIIQSYVTH